MRRSIAAALLLVISLPLIPLAAPADPQSKLPACCRRDGKHGCSMMDNRNSAEPAAATLKAAKSKCPSFPTGKSTPAVSAFPVAASRVYSTPPVDRLGGIAQTEARYRLSFSRTRQKRGPPSLLS